MKIPRATFALKNPSSSKESLIYLYYRLPNDSKRIAFSTQEYCQPKYWDTPTRKVKNSIAYPKGASINRELYKFSEITEQIFIEFNGEINSENFKDELDYRTGRKERPISSSEEEMIRPLFIFIEEFVKECQEHGKRGTWKKFITVRNHLLNYQKEKGIELTYEKLNWKFRRDFISWLYAPPRNHATNNASKIFEVIKQFLQESYKLEYHKNDIFLQRGFGIKRVKTNNKTVFSFDDLDKIIKLDLSDNRRLEKARDLFIVGCYTGLRYSDWHKVKNENIIVQNGYKIWDINTMKTNTDVYIPRIPVLKTILEKYDYKLPSISAQKFNDYIKEVIEIVFPNTTTKVTTSIGGKTEVKVVPKYSVTSSHCARRSFATNFFELGIPAPILMQVTGHTTQKQFFDYVDADKKKLAEQFARLVEEKWSERK